MAGDTRDSSPKYETFTSPPPSANTLPPGSGQNTAGAHPSAPSLAEAIKTVRLGDFKQVHMYPCARDAFIFGIASGFGVGGLRFALGAPVAKWTNWAVGTFIFGALGSYEFCHYRRQLERTQMKRVVEIMETKRAEKEQEAQRRRDERRRKKEEHDKAVEAERKRSSSWKFW